MSAYHEKLRHGAGLIMISKAYFTAIINKHVCDIMSLWTIHSPVWVIPSRLSVAKT